jgi:solute carrier family 25 carnitine/acylcarnitine transporter 20/29
MLDCNFIIKNSVVVCINTPFELIKMKMQSDIEKFSSITKVAKEIYSKKGIRGLYKGYCVTLSRDFISYGSYFWVYFMLKDYFDETSSVTSFKLFCTGGLAGVISWIIGYPFDPIKTIIQTDKSDKTITQLDAYKLIKSKYGYSGFFRGLSPVLLRAFLVHGVIFKTNEVCRYTFEKYFMSSNKNKYI